jgi:mevalonyl-CoA ligase
VFFTTQSIGRADNRKLIDGLENTVQGPKVVILRGDSGSWTTYNELIASPTYQDVEKLLYATSRVLPHQVCNLQFTSGTTGHPKAAMLTHQ